MRKKEVNKERLKAIVSHLICENSCICDVINKTKSRRSNKFLVQIKNDNQSLGSKKNCHVILGVANLAKLYDICKDFCRMYNYEFNINNNIFEYYNYDEVCIDNYDLEEEHLQKVTFLNELELGSAVTLVINALAFTLYHEFGHVELDEEFRFSIENERNADFFALNLFKERCSSQPKIEVCNSPIFLGALLEMTLILQMCDPIYSEIDTSHPHPIERLYMLLEYFHVGENSYLWQYVYNMVVKWINDHNMAMSFEKDSSKTAKDKFLDAYFRFKK